MQSVRYLVLTMLLLCCSSLAMAQKTTPAQSLEQQYNRAYDLFQKEKFAPAQHLFDIIDKSHPMSSTGANACYYAAACAIALDNDDAESRLNNYLSLYPHGAYSNMATFFLGSFYYRHADYSKALKQFKKVNRMSVDFDRRAEYDFKMAYCLFSTGDSKAAKKLFSQQIAGTSKYRNPSLYYYAHIQYLDGEYDLALKNFSQLQSDAHFANIVPNYIARLYYYLGRYDDLIQMAPDLLQAKNVYKKTELLQMVAEIYYNRGEYANALNYYREVERALSDSASSSSACSPHDNNYQIGFCYYMTYRFDSAAIFLAKKQVCQDSVSQNALYTLADAYLRTNRPELARSAFLQASQMDFDPAIKEDALFNYAKLSCQLNKNPYNESIHSFQNYLASYPNTPHRAEIEEILASLFLSTRNYKDALALIEKIDKRSVELNRAYQRILLNRGIELFNVGDMSQASSFFAKSAKVNVVPRVTADANFLFGEAQYRLGDFPAASKAMDRFLLSSDARQSAYYPQALYTQGYLSMHLQHYDDAATLFEKFLSLADTSVSLHQRCDAYNRLGDCRYVSRDFASAIPYYNFVIDANDIDADYASLQKAMAYGAMGKYGEKLVFLNKIYERYPTSPLVAKAKFELANTYLLCENDEMAILYFKDFIDKYPSSVYVKEALLSMGVAYYNNSRYEEALAAFDRLLTRYPGTQEARDALISVKNIYITLNRVDEYFAYLRKNTNINVSNIEQDSTIYMAAEDRYMEGDYAKAVSGFQRYLDAFPQGLFSLQSHFYLADALFHQGDSAKALPHYQYVAQAPKNQFSDNAMTLAAVIAYDQMDYRSALPMYRALAANAESDNGRLQGLLGSLRCCSRLGLCDSASLVARSLLANDKASADILDEAALVIARCSFDAKNFNTASFYFQKLIASLNGDYAGEANFRLAEMQFLDSAYSEAEQIIDNYSNTASSDYWLAKCFILWADIYVARGNSLQAKQTLQSIIDNYDGDDLVALAKNKLEAIILSESPSSSSHDDDSPVIEL